MRILKYTKISKNKYKLELENKEKIILYEDIILQEELLLKKNIDNLEPILKKNEEYVLYDKTLSYMNKKMRCEKEIRDYLEKYTKNKLVIEEIIKKLKQNHFINEELYLKSFFHDKMNLTMDGPLKIKRDLERLDFSIFQIEDSLEEFKKEQKEDRIKKYIEKQIKRNNKSPYVFKQKMILNLSNLGYEKEDIMNVLDKIEINESSLKEKEQEKLTKKYGKKLQGTELENIVKQKLYEKGYWR